MISITEILKEQYGIDCGALIPQRGGFSALAFRAEAGDKTYFFKAYEKRNASTAFWTAHIDDYMPILLWLNRTPLAGSIVRPVLTRWGGYKCEDAEHVYLLYDYIFGETVERRALTDAEVLSLAEIMGQLHSYGREIPFDTRAISEDFDLFFCDGLENNKDRLPDVLFPYRKRLFEKIAALREMRARAEAQGGNWSLCHTDAHGWNLMRGERLILIDWEGLRFAPAEADLFMFFHKPWWPVFFGRYLEMRPGFMLNEEMLEFYMLRRKLEDIWADLERVLFDPLSPEEYDEEMGRAITGLERLDDKLII